MLPKKQLSNVPVYQPGKSVEQVKKELGLSSVIKLASNENPLGCSPLVHESLIKELERLAIYPDGGCMELREKLAGFLEVPQDYLIFGNGSDEIVQLIARTYLQPGTKTVMATPTFPQYKSNAMIENAEVIEVPLKDGIHDLPAMLDKIDEQTRVVWICNPNNPSGTMVSEQELVAFLEKLPKNVLAVIDEAYFEYVVDAAYPDSIKLLSSYENVIVLRTFSKIYGLAALRIGYGVAHPQIIEDLEHVREPFNVNRLAHRAAISALDDQDFVAQCRRLNRAGMDQLGKGFAEMGLTWYPSQANFVLVHVRANGNSVFQSLQKEGIIVRSGVPLGFPEYVRITIGTEEQNAKVLVALKKVLAS